MTTLHTYRWLYWTDYGTVNKIEKASMDGTSRAVVINTGLSLPYGLTMDYDSQTLYWIDDGVNRLESSNTDGSNRMLLTTLNIQSPYGITYFAGKLYWTDVSRDAIMSTFLDSPNSVSTIITTASNNPYRIKVVSEQRQPEGM